MIEVTIPGRGRYEIKHLVLDLNGTIALDGSLISGVSDRLQRLANLLSIYVITADTYGCASHLENDLPIKLLRIEKGNEAAQKLALIEQLGKANTVAIGNGSNDVLMLRESALGICVLGTEGAATEALMASTVVVTDINAALDLLSNSSRLVATLRK